MGKLLFGFRFTEAALAFLATIPPKQRKQVVTRAKDLLRNPHPVGSKPLKGVTSEDGEPVYRERSGDYRILYLVLENPGEIIILDIDNRKDVYRMKSNKLKEHPGLHMKANEFDDMMRKALGVPSPIDSTAPMPKPKAKRRKSRPTKNT